MTHSNVLVKQRIALRAILQGRGFHVALACMNIGESYHSGVRKDGTTPEFMHQIQMALYILSLPLPLQNEARDMQHIMIAAAFLHDLFEDYPVSPREIEIKMERALSDGLCDAQRTIIKRAIECAMFMSKVVDGQKLDMNVYMSRFISGPPLAALLKGVDRMHNFNSMVGVFSAEKQRSYIDEGTEIVSMMRVVRKNTPFLSDAFFAVEHLLSTQIDLISHSLDAAAILEARIADLEVALKFYEDGSVARHALADDKSTTPVAS